MTRNPAGLDLNGRHLTVRYLHLPLPVTVYMLYIQLKSPSFSEVTWEICLCTTDSPSRRTTINVSGSLCRPRHKVVQLDICCFPGIVPKKGHFSRLLLFYCNRHGTGSMVLKLARRKGTFLQRLPKNHLDRQKIQRVTMTSERMKRKQDLKIIR